MQGECEKWGAGILLETLDVKQFLELNSLCCCFYDSLISSFLSFSTSTGPNSFVRTLFKLSISYLP